MRKVEISSDDDALLDFADLDAEGTSRSTAYRAIASGALRAVKQFRRTKFRRGDYRAYVRSLPAVAPKRAA